MTTDGPGVDLYDSLEGQVALVTGATRGIGAAIAADLADLGATVYAGARDTDDVTAADQRPIRLDVNLRGSVLVTRHALPLLLDGDGGRVVTLSSDLGQFTRGEMGGGYPAYRVSKVGLGGLTAYLDGEYASRGLIANAASPGWVRTDMGGAAAPRSPAEGAETPVWLARFREGPGGRLWKDREAVAW